MSVAMLYIIIQLLFPKLLPLVPTIYIVVIIIITCIVPITILFDLSM